MPGSARRSPGVRSATRSGWCAMVSAALRYARILNGFSFLISRRSPISASTRATARLSIRGRHQLYRRYNALMSIREFRRHAGQLVIAGFAGHSIPADLRTLAKEFDLGGIILFARNVESPEQVAEISREAQLLAGELPLWVSVDQEGGRVARLRSPFTVWPAMHTLGRSGDET